MIDIGVNLTNGQFKNDIDQVLQESFSSGIEAMILTGTDLESSIQCRELCEKYAHSYSGQLFCTAGVHPHDASTWSDNASTQVLELLNSPYVVASGETGLDFNRNYSSKEDQIRAFEGQIELAAQTAKPLFLHERDAFDTQIDILRNYRDQFDKAVIHCFTGSQKALFAYLDLDFHIGITGWICDERRGIELAKMVADIPLNRLMVETDSPFLLPRNIQPKPSSRRNEPRYLNWVVKKISESFETDEMEIQTKTSATAREFFALAST